MRPQFFWLAVAITALLGWYGRFNFTSASAGGEGAYGIVYRTNLWTGETYILHGVTMKKIKHEQ